MMTPFRFFVGGPLGSGRQYLSWIHRIDWIEMIRWIVETPSITGAGQRHRAGAGDQPRSSRARSAARCIARHSCRRRRLR